MTPRCTDPTCPVCGTPAKPPFSKTAQIIVATMGLALLLSLFTAYLCTVFWGWFLEAEYGSGPSLEAWFGAWATVRLLMRGDDKSTQAEVNAALRSWFLMAQLMIGKFVDVVAIFASAWLAGKLFGWI